MHRVQYPDIRVDMEQAIVAGIAGQGYGASVLFPVAVSQPVCPDTGRLTEARPITVFQGSQQAAIGQHVVELDAEKLF